MPASAQPASILIVDDDEGLLVLMAEALRAERYRVDTAGSWAAALARLGELTPDLLLLDLKLKDVGGPALLKRLRRDEVAVPFVVVTGQGDEKVAVEVMKQGALDYVMKDTALLDLLPAVVKRALTAVERDRALAAAEQERRRLEHEVLQISEREQHRIGVDLHDGLGQQLTAIEMLCTSLKTEAADRPELAGDLATVSKLLREAITHVRLLARGLVPVKGEPDALQTSLMELAERTRSLGRFRCRFECPAAVLVTNHAAAGHLFRIAQEAVNNAMKHSEAREIVIGLTRQRGAVELRVADDGRGLRKSVRPAGMGLHVMKHRANVIGADLTIESKLDKGTTVTCRWQEQP